MEILEDLNTIRKQLGLLEVSKNIIANVKNTMSDRHSAEKLFSSLLNEYRETILPKVVSGWNDLTAEEQEQMTRMNNFYCGLHYLVGLADAAEATIKIWKSTFNENGHEQDIEKKASSGTQCLIRTSCISFLHRGSEQAGCSTLFRTYCRHKGIHKIPLAAFQGNRFNILFHDAAGVYYLKSHMIENLKNHHGSTFCVLTYSLVVRL